MTRFTAALALACALFVSTAEARPQRHQRSDVITCDQQGCHGETVIAKTERGRVRRADGNGSGIVAHPAGCPRRLFCGCGVSVKAFGRPIRELFLASNYGYYFNVGAFAAGNAAWRPGHVVYILGGSQSDALVYDPNSGHRQTRIHHRDLSRYRIADLSSPKRRLASR